MAAGQFGADMRAEFKSSNFKYTFSATKPTEARLSEVEAELGRPLPHSYRRFLQEFNGGVLTSPNCIPIVGLDNDPYLQLLWLLGIDTLEGWSDLLHMRRIDVENNLMLPELLCIGNFDFNGSLCLVIDGPRLGQVWYWDFLEKPEIPSWQNCFFVANSFEDIPGLLFPCP